MNKIESDKSMPAEVMDCNDIQIDNKLYAKTLEMTKETLAEALDRFDCEVVLCLVCVGRLPEVLARVKEPDFVKHADDFEFVIEKLWRRSLFYEVHMLCEAFADPSGYLLDWYNFWACIELSEFDLAAKSLSKLSLKGLFKRLTDRKDNVRSDQLNELFQLNFHFNKMPRDLFLIMLSTLFEGYVDQKELDEKYSYHLDEAHKDIDNNDKSLLYGNDYADLNARIALLEVYMHKSVEFAPDFLHFTYELLFAAYRSLQTAVVKMVAEAKKYERDRVLSNLSHSIKNILKSVIDPLLTLREDNPEDAPTINNALKGANLIREMVNAVNLSYKTSLEDLIWDIQHPGNDAVSLQSMICDSLRYSVSNMFDFRYFPVYAGNYFPRSIARADYKAIEEEWNEVTGSGKLADLKSFIARHFFTLELDLADSLNYLIGNEKSSAIKLMILVQEIIFNAVKYSSFIPFKDRFVTISLRDKGQKLSLEVANSFDPAVRAKTTGVGKVVIENFARVLDCEPVMKTENNEFSISMEFNNLWRDNAKDTIR